ncbi:MAG: FAD binding domain-containing protein [Burkholderiales bacterium]|nr:FAD binding domain-containing protein [Burkholderiales bacterium]
MNLPEVAYFSPASLAEASALLAAHGERARALAGGTAVLGKMKQRRLLPRVLVNLKRIPGLDYVRWESAQGLRIGALARLEAVSASVEVRKRYPILHDAVSCMGTLEIRNTGTLAGNLCNASPAAETLPALMLLEAVARVFGPAGTRDIPVAELVTGPGRTALGAGEILTEIEIPPPAPGWGGAYDKFSLRRMDLAVAGAAAAVAMQGEAVREARIVLSAVAPRAIRAPGGEAAVRGRAPQEALLAEAGRLAAADASPRADLTGGVAYKRDALAALVTRVLRVAIERARRAA